MPRGRPKKEIEVEDNIIVDEPVEESAPTPTISTVSEKVRLLALYKELQDLKVTSLSNLENRIAQAE